jgi:S1-C subfamily serine protease
VERGSPADRAGLQGIGVTRRGRYVLGDVIVAVNGEAVSSVDDFLYALEGIGVGKEATLTVERSGDRRDLRVKLIGE